MKNEDNELFMSDIDYRWAKGIRMLLVILGLSPLLTVGCQSSLVPHEQAPTECEHPARKTMEL